MMQGPVLPAPPPSVPSKQSDIAVTAKPKPARSRSVHLLLSLLAVGTMVVLC
jgi:hypothetical protein